MINLAEVVRNIALFWKTIVWAFSSKPTHHYATICRLYRLVHSPGQFYQWDPNLPKIQPDTPGLFWTFIRIFFVSICNTQVCAWRIPYPNQNQYSGILTAISFVWCYSMSNFLDFYHAQSQHSLLEAQMNRNLWDILLDNFAVCSNGIACHRYNKLERGRDEANLRDMGIDLKYIF